MLQIKNNIGGDNGGFYPSVLVTGLSETDTVTMTGEGKTYTPKWITKETTIQGYTQLDYIQSSGTQYIDTGISGGANASYEIMFRPTSSNVSYQQYFAGDKNPTIPKLCENSTSYTTLFIEVGTTNTTTSISSSTRNTVKYNSDGSITVNGTSITGLPTTAGAGWGSLTWWIFNAHEEPTLYANMELYGLKMWTDGILVRNFVPAKRNSDSVIGLYDSVSHTFFTNAGTGTFTAGSETSQIEEVVTTKYWLFEKITKLGTYEITATDGTNTTTKEVLIDASIEYEVDIVLHFDIVSWSDGTDKQIAAMVAAADKGLIDLSDYWAVGDERQVTLSAMSATGVGESHAEQTVTFVLMNASGKTLANTTPSGRTECSFIVGMKNGLAEKGYMNSSNTNSGGWESCARRTWCNSIFRDAIPSTLRDIFKQHLNITANGSSTTTATSTDYFALPAEKEIFGAVTYANSTAEASLMQFEYYKTSANRIKKQGDAGSASTWWERSPKSSLSSDFCTVDSNGGAYYLSASTTRLLSPFGCI